jgi:mRNA interferase MazF
MLSTTTYKRGDIVLVSFPFTDLSSSKRRPALVVSPDAFNETTSDLVLAAITSQISEDTSLTIVESDCVDGALPKHRP